MRGDVLSFSNFASPAKSIRIDNVLNRTTGVSARLLYKRRMISSTCRSPAFRDNYRTTSAEITSRDAVFFCYHGKRSDRYHSWVAPGAIGCFDPARPPFLSNSRMKYLSPNFPYSLIRMVCRNRQLPNSCHQLASRQDVRGGTFDDRGCLKCLC